MRKKEANFYFKQNKFRLHVNDFGFTLWDEVDKRWLIDASCIQIDNRFSVGTPIHFDEIKKTKVKKIASKNPRKRKTW
jgi:hypothetical protein